MQQNGEELSSPFLVAAELWSTRLHYLKYVLNQNFNDNFVVFCSCLFQIKTEISATQKKANLENQGSLLSFENSSLCMTKTIIAFILGFYVNY